jgi:hypothetical protein
MPGGSKRQQRVVFWDLTQMDYRFPLFREDRMLLPAMMDMFKTNHIRSLFMGAGNAQNTKAASAMADNVLFCWRSTNKGKNGRRSQPALMLYVDRASPSSQRQGKALYRLPIDSRGKLVLPTTTSDLDEPQDQEQGFKVDITRLTGKNEDVEIIRRITDMQGVS